MRPLVLLLLPAFLYSADNSLRGFPARDVPRQTQWESKAREIPQPERIREYIRRISDKPHHAGSPGSKAVAGYLLGLLRGWGLDASIEEFEALLPHSHETQAGAGDAHPVHGGAGGVDRQRRQEHARRWTAPNLQCVLQGGRCHRATGVRQLRHPRGLRVSEAAGDRRQGQDGPGAVRIELAGSEAESRLRTRRGRLPDLLRSEGRRLLRRRCVSAGAVPPQGRRPAR